MLNNLNRRVVRFAIVGIGATIIHLLVASFLVAYFPQIQIISANAIAFSIAVFFSFLGHSYFTFQVQGSLIKFATTAIIGLACNNIVAYTVLWLSGLKILSVVVGTLAAPVVVYFLSSFWVFTHKKTKTHDL